MLEIYRGQLMVAHGGALPGMISAVLLVPERELGVVVLTNSESEAASLLALQVADLFLIDEGEGPGKDYLGAVHARLAEQAADAEPSPIDASGGPLPDSLIGEYQNPMLGGARIERVDDSLWFVAHEHGGLRCQFAPGLVGPAPEPDARELAAACTWADPNMGVSVITLERTPAGRRQPDAIGALRFRVRPDFYDPLEYTFTRRR